MTRPVHITAENFDSEVLQSPQPVLVDFWAAWCAPCRLVAPIVEDLAREYAGVLKVAKLDVDELPDLAERYQVQGIPTLAIFAGGSVVTRIVGYVPKAELQRRIEPVLRTVPRSSLAEGTAREEARNR